VRVTRSELPLSAPLSSINSAAAVAGLFVDFAGTMGTSDFLLPCMLVLPSLTFTNRSTSKEMEDNRTSRFSRQKSPHMHKVFDSAAS